MTHEQRNYSESIQYATVNECACYKSPVIVLSHAKNKHQFQLFFGERRLPYFRMNKLVHRFSWPVLGTRLHIN